ncbi:MAG: PilZ domain-containing protein [Candidatus Accumulibacter sp.]|nr:PilZ domain-containing protein [Accumulibacter sp.]
MNATQLLARGFIRHPADIPIEIDPADSRPVSARRLKDVSRGGLACRCEQPLPVGARVRVTIPLVQPPFSASGAVVWCRTQGTDCEVGIRFTESDDEFAVRMIEQVCHIEHYRQEVLRKEGRLLDGEAAAREWIDHFAASFPGCVTDHTCRS